MPYYAGGYYAGGYYAGGIFGNLFTGVKKIVGGAIGGFITKGPVGAIAGAAGGAVSAVRTNVAMETLAAGDQGSALTPALKAKHAAALLRGGGGGGLPKPGTALMLPPPMQIMGMGGPLVGATGAVMGMRGYHANRSTYVTRGGGTSHYPPGLQIHPPGSTLVRSRRMNWGNSRALVRAERRVAAFVKHATKYIKWVHPHRVGHAVPKFAKRRKR